MTFNLTIDCDNAAFEDDPNHEVGTILRYLSMTVSDGRREGRIMDSNGNSVGEFHFSEF